MSTDTTGSLPHCPEHGHTTVLPPSLLGRFPQIPNEVHALVRSPREYQLVGALLAFRWHPWSPMIPSVCTLAAMLQCSHRTIRRTAEKMEARGLLRREERHAHDRRQMSNEYVLCGLLLAVVTALEATRVQEERQTWPGGRSGVASKRDQRNQKNRTTQQNKLQQQPAGSLSELIQTREGTLSRLNR